MGSLFSITFNVDSLWRCWGCIHQRLRYLYKLQEDLESLQSACQKLRELRNDVQRQVDMAEREQLQPLEQVFGWLSRVEVLETQGNQLILDGTRALQQKCLGGCCPRHCRTQYRLGKRVAKLSKNVGQLIEERPQSVVAQSLPPPGVTERPREVTVDMTSRLDLAWSCLHEDRVGILGLYGLGGVGKTTLLTEIHNAFAERAHDFDFVIWATVSRNVDIEKIQDDIWQKVGICDDKWKSKSRDEKAACIWNALNKNRFVLLLDDIWERLNLVDVGVPVQNKSNKIVLTTRSAAVCGEMEADRSMRVECLTWTASWELFQRKVGEDTLKLHPGIPKLAEAIARECCGLPIVLITMGRAMACRRTPQEWRYALKVLQNSASEFPGMGDKVLPLLKYTYDTLRSEAAQCFLYCSLWPEDSVMNKQRIIECWIGEGLLDGYDDDFEAATHCGYNVMGTLLHACLLQEMDNGMCVTMHDVIRDMALWIARESSRAQDRFLVKAGHGLTEAPEVGEWMEVKRISLTSNQIDQLIGSPNCPSLHTLHLGGNPLKMITDDFFRFMPQLRVLDLSSTSFTELPRGVSNLVSLQYLNLSRSKIKQMPNELKNLTELKVLLLLEMPQFLSIPKQLLSRLSKLQVIEYTMAAISDGAVLKDDLLSNGNEALVKELDSLKYLHDVFVPITTATALERLLGSDKLRSCIYILELQNFNTSTSLSIASLNTAKHLNKLVILDCVLLEDLEIDCPWKRKEGIESSCLNSNFCFQSLEYVMIEGCHKLKDLTWLVFAPNLINLVIRRCSQMQEVVSRDACAEYVEDGESLSPFGTLRELVVTELPLLKSIFWKALPFPYLKTMIIGDCPLLKKLPLDTNSAKGHRVSIYATKDWWNELEWEDEAPHNISPCFIHEDEFRI